MALTTTRQKTQRTAGTSRDACELCVPGLVGPNTCRSVYATHTFIGLLGLQSGKVGSGELRRPRRSKEEVDTMRGAEAVGNTAIISGP